MIWQFVYVWFLYALIPLLVIVAWLRWYYYKQPLHQFPLTQVLIKRSGIKRIGSWRIYYIRYVLRSATILALIFALARLQTIDEQSRIPVDGIDIMLALDVSESMTLYDDPQDSRTRREVACVELLKFIQNRPYDPMGLVIFGAAAVSRCPLTLDKQLLMKIVKEVAYDYVLDPQGTVLCTGLAMAANRLRTSSSKSKIIILLTDGAPTAGDIAPGYALDLLINLGIKVYVIGIGSSGGYLKTPFGFMQQQAPLNTELLDMIAQKTGGQFFQAHKPDDLKTIYATIDTLEKNSHDMPRYGNYTDWFIWFLLGAALLFCIELILISFVRMTL